METKKLIIGACGQIGSELTVRLKEIYGSANVVAADIVKGKQAFVKEGPFEVVNALDFNQIQTVVEKHNVDEVYLMAALLSATAEKNPAFAWDLNMGSLFHILNLAKAGKIKRYFGPPALLFLVPPLPEKTPHNTPSWNLRLCMEYLNKQANAGASITTPTTE